MKGNPPEFPDSGRPSDVGKCPVEGSGRTEAGRIPAPRRRSRWRALGRAVELLFVLGLVAAGCVAWDAWHFLHTPPAAEGRDVVVNIEPGSPLSRTADLLQSAGVVADSFRFQILARTQEKGGRIQAGRFLVNTGWLPQQVLDQLVSGRALLHRVTVPEGLPWWEVGRLLEREGLCRAADFERVIHDPAFLGHGGIPFDSAEGFLYPDTYFLPRPRKLDEQAARAVAGRMVDTFWRRTASLWGEGGRPDPATLRRIVTLASIVEKETGLPAERARVAGVYANRLKRGMLLQADPTVIYGLGPGFSGSLRRGQLADESNPYNTYRKAGLPPGPICSPGAAALEAALAPEDHDYLYFVAGGENGSHVFSSTLKDHNRAVRAYRNAMRGRS